MLHFTTAAAEFVLYGVCGGCLVVTLALAVIAMCYIRRSKANSRLMTSGLLSGLFRPTSEIKPASNFRRNFFDIGRDFFQSIISRCITLASSSVVSFLLFVCVFLFSKTSIILHSNKH